MGQYYSGTDGERFNEGCTSTIVYCRLFEDMIRDTVCGLRRQVLASGKGLSCRGCIMNIALDGEMRGR